MPMLDFWKSREAKLPRLAAIARDILTIPAASLGIERVFSIARDVCYFRRSALALDTIQAEMVKYYHDHKDSEEVERSRLSNLETEYSEMTTPEEIEQDLQQRIDLVAAAMEHSYISKDEFDDIEEDSLRHQNYQRRSKPQRR
jgi:hypothetical protein